MTENPPFVYFFHCSECGARYQPYGDLPMILPATTNVVCPKCGFKEIAIWDDEINREVSRKRLGLSEVKKPDPSLGAISLTELKFEISSIKAKLEDLTEQVAQLTNTIETMLPETKELIKEVITNILIEKEQSKKPNLNPV